MEEGTRAGVEPGRHGLLGATTVTVYHCVAYLPPGEEGQVDP